MAVLDRQQQFQKALQRFPHLQTYLKGWEAEGNELPEFVVQLSSDMAKLDRFNVLYPTRDPVFIHCFLHSGSNGKRYSVLEPLMSEPLRAKFKSIMDLILKKAPEEPAHENTEQFSALLDRLLERVTSGSAEPTTRLFKEWEDPKVVISAAEMEVVRYYLRRNIIESGILEGILRDNYIEDVHSVGTADIFIVHKVFNMMRTNVRFSDELELDAFLRSMSERIGKPVSDSKPIVDGSLPDGSRINIIYSDDVSQKGSSFTIRKFSPTPLTFTRLVSWGTFSPLVAAYLWLALEFGMNCIVSGETASGKTTSLNSVLTFINHSAKVYTAEDTPEVIAPQPVWQRLVTRDTGPQESRVDLFDLIRAALRSRPNYIIVGETRGREGAMMFQAMQTGHSVMSTFHAPSTTQMIQRFTGEPINVPIRFFDNLNIAVFQKVIYDQGRLIRRVVSVDEILRYSKQLDGVLVRSVFQWDPFTDTHYFRGMNNSYILEEKIAPQLKFEDKRMIYTELQKRARFIQAMVDHHIFEYAEVNRIMASYYAEGEKGLPPEILS